MKEPGINILSPTDFSENARGAFEYALSMWGDEPHCFYLLHAYQTLQKAPEFLISVDDILRENSQQSLEQELAHFKHFPVHQKTDFKILNYPGPIESVIPKVVVEHQVDMVVMGTKGVLGGNHTSKIIGKTQCPLMVIPENTRFIKPERIIVATDLQKIKNPNIINRVVSISKKFDSQLSFLNISGKEGDVARKDFFENWQFNSHLQGVDFDFNHIEEKQVLKGISQFVKDQKADMIVLISRQYPLLQRIFHKSITKDMSMQAQLPLLII